jgi:hypothetical protein
MKKLVLLAPTAALLFACSGSSGVSIQPGQWETTIHFTQIDMPGAPEAMVAPLRAAMSTPRTESYCMSPEQAANPTGAIVDPSGPANACQYGDSTFANGVIRVRGTCQDPTRGRMEITLDGTFTATTMEARMTTAMQPPAGRPGPQSVTLSGTYASRRTGDCTAAPPPARPAPPAPPAPAGGNTTG